jgi:hypothetical protein
MYLSLSAAYVLVGHCGALGYSAGWFSFRRQNMTAPPHFGQPTTLVRSIWTVALGPMKMPALENHMVPQFAVSQIIGISWFIFPPDTSVRPNSH